MYLSASTQYTHTLAMLKYFPTLLFAFGILFSQPLTAQSTTNPVDLKTALKWRCIGPHRGGRTVGAVGVPQQPYTFYIGVNNGGVWKTIDAGRTWQPIFDEQPTGSVGDVAVAPSDPNVLYVATGEGIQRPDLSVGDGIYKSTDAGKTWEHLGLRDGLQIGGLAIDPTNPNRVFAAVLGHPYGPNPERGVYRSLDGGKTWTNVLFKDENTGAIQVTIDPENPNIVYADLFATRLAPWENGRWYGPNSGLFKSEDGGTTWHPLTKGLPTPAQGLGRIGFCVCPSLPSRLYATVDAGDFGGIYRSDDSGESWKKTTGDERYWDRGDDFGEIRADPKNPDIVYSANVVTWKSTDGGHGWSAFRGAPGGDDYHRIWINPNNTDIMLIASDQGAIITLNGGQSFSSWYNQATAQFYHVSTDNSFPYNVYGGQQESGSVGISSRGNDGGITFREWHSVGVEEYGYVAADPLDPNIIYGGKITRYDKRTGQTQNIAPEAVRTGEYRFIRTAPVLFSPIDPKTLYFAGNVVFKTTTGGKSWDVISPDLTRETYTPLPKNIGVFATKDMEKMPRRGVIYTLAPSSIDIQTIWAGTDDGLLHVTRDGGKNWTNVTPPSVSPWSKVSLMEASHFDVNTCYAAINSIRLDDLRPHILRTRDGGKTWLEITAGLPDNEPINAVREDPMRKGLLFAGSERAVHVSFDDGEHWQSLRLNMPATSIRDLVIHQDDIVVGTHGRSFWILDDISPLRDADFFGQNTQPDIKLFQPQTATRVRWNMNNDTPLPQEEPAGENPPDGAIIHYFLKNAVAGPVTLDIIDRKGQVVHRYSSTDVRRDQPEGNTPPYWLRPAQELSGAAGMHRFCWDMRYQPLAEVPLAYPIAATFRNTAPEPTAPFVMTGDYTVRLTAGGKSYEQTLTVRMDPRVKTAFPELQQQHDLSFACYRNRRQALNALNDIRSLRSQISSRSAMTASASFSSMHPKTDTTALFTALRTADRQLAAFETAPRGSKAPDYSSLNYQFSGLFGNLQDCDMVPTSQTIAAVTAANTVFEQVENSFRDFRNVDLIALNKTLATSGVSQLLLADQPEYAHHPVITSGKDWKPLFDKKLTNASFPAGVWYLENSDLTASKDECIWTKQVFNDFQLDLEFKTAEGTNSGVIIHCSNTDNWIPNSMEIQIADDFSKEWSEAPTTWQCGAIFGHLPARQHRVKHAGEWNHMTITSRDRFVWVVLNDELVNVMDMSRWTAASRNPDGTSIPSWLSQPFATLPLTGHIGLQGKHAGKPIYFRNMRVREIK